MSKGAKEPSSSALCGVERHARGVGHTCVSLVLNPRIRTRFGRPRPTRGRGPYYYGGLVPRVHAGHLKNVAPSLLDIMVLRETSKEFLPPKK